MELTATPEVRPDEVVGQESVGPFQASELQVEVHPSGLFEGGTPADQES